ncbi:MAG TPA: energy transducer TonB [Thermoanaerobaculia bacterium]|nr:energy transducer TonB [Thermoanaerobaculia bacterium]
MNFARYVTEANRKKRIMGRYRASAGALAFHGLLISAFIFGGHSAKQTLQSEKSMIAFIARGAAPPPPPPPPPKSGGGAPKSTPRVESKPVQQVRPHTLIAPREIPKELPRVEPLQTANALPDVAPGVVEDAGVPEGVTGGVTGGEVGGVVGGVVGGTQGGEVGGVVGGQLGGTGTGTEGTGTGGNDAPLVATPPPPPPPPPPAPEPEPVPNTPLRVGGDVKAPVTIDRVEPVYTETARKARIAGTVVVEAIISKSGRVEDVKVLKGLPMGLSMEAEEAVKKWRFKPGTLNGEPVATIFNLTVTFKLDN